MATRALYSSAQPRVSTRVHTRRVLPRSSRSFLRISAHENDRAQLKFPNEHTKALSFSTSATPTLLAAPERRSVLCRARGRRRAKRDDEEDDITSQSPSESEPPPETEDPEEVAASVTPEASAEPEPEVEAEPEATETAEEAVIAEEQEEEKEEEVIAGGPIDWEAEWEAEQMAQQTGTDPSQLKASLLDSFYGTERGLNVSSDARAEITELITRLESLNPTATPTEELGLLSGTWKLAYTTNSELSLLLASSKLPLVEVRDITQTIDTNSKTVENCLELQTPLSKQSFSASADFEIRSPKRVQVLFKEGKIATPQLLENVDLPSTLSIAGQTIDTSPLKGAVTTLQSLLQPASSFLSQQPDFSFKIQNDKATSWLVTTYLDDDLRIARGDAGSIFVLTKAFAL
mmetsp:Transcript_22378/g.26969  ORF Transcript_22378/g.26969 Transcript_22378/m.26969 type:complete len:404 (-) Transcript_22378:392-1603(-)